MNGKGYDITVSCLP